jgi:energy-coupling factor transport system substrate-specific component
VAIFFFLWSFERRKPQTREVVVLAVMTALAVAGRMIFFMTPQFKPCAAIIIITGIMLGKESGFLCGAMTAFVSDFFFGQGPWTPWQMVAFGIIGYVSAILFSGKFRKWKDNRYILCGYGFLMTFVVYGLILDTATVFMYTDEPKAATFAAAYASGLVFNAIHGISTVIFLWILSGTFIRKLERIKIKYGIFIK